MSPLEQAVRQAIGLHQAGDLVAARAAYEVILKQHPKDPNVLMNLSTLLVQQGELEAGAALLKRLIEFYPKLPQPHFGYGNVLQRLGRYDEAELSFERNIALMPDHANAHWNLSMTQLMRGDFPNGLKRFEWRWKSDHLKATARHYDEPLWLGAESLAGKTILIWPEQGFGDFIQHARYLPMLVAQGAKLVVEVPPALMRLMQHSFPELTLVLPGVPLPPIDFQCPIMSLPLALGITVETIPATVPYLSVPGVLMQGWGARLGPREQKRIGLVWSGAAHHVNDRNRSLPLAQLAPLLALPFDFHSLQKEVRAEDMAALPGVQSHAQALQDFADTAALIEQMELVIAVDTSVAHLAGALGKPVWLLLPTPADYRWLLARTDSPLYPTMRLFRQPTPSDWPNVISAVIEAVNHQI